jgi:hypothetical protein
MLVFLMGRSASIIGRRIMHENGWEFASLKFVKGSRGGLFLDYFLPFDSPLRLRLRLRLSLVQNQEDCTGLEMVLAQLGRNGWDLVSKASHEAYVLKRIILAERPIDRPLLVGFESRDVVEPLVAESSKSEPEPRLLGDEDLRLAAARMGIAIG